MKMQALAFSLLSIIASAMGDPPPLPGALGENSTSSTPTLPGILGGEGETEPVEKTASKANSVELTGFAELRIGARLHEAGTYDDLSLAEARVQLSVEEEWKGAVFEFVGDLVYDDLEEDHGFDWESGSGWLDVRSLNISFQPLSSVDMKIGRQVATWGVGDLLFVNDLFPKDWNSFFLGRDEEYLKAPQDSLRVSYFSDWANVDFIYSPRFDSDRFVDGNRLSYWDGFSGGVTMDPTPTLVSSPGDAWDADEVHLRISKLIGRYEWAAYGYDGYWKSPEGMDPNTGRGIFPRLRVLGASTRGPLASGIVSVEVGSYDSLDDPQGDNPYIANSELRFLVGYERELASELTGSVQYYVERTRDFAASGGVGDRQREVVTLRLTKQLWHQTLTLSGFVFYSPNQKDSYTRLSASWKASDEWRYDIGANLFSGDSSSFLGQFELNENVYISMRRLF